MFNSNDWPLLCPPVDLPDQAAAQIADFLMEFALWFENTHFSQIRRYDRAMTPLPTYNPYQLELFDPF